jgi:hypothetical protein
VGTGSKRRRLPFTGERSSKNTAVVAPMAPTPSSTRESIREEGSGVPEVGAGDKATPLNSRDPVRGRPHLEKGGV